MAVKIRLKRFGKVRAAFYRVVVVDSRTKRDGRVIEEIGKYHPTEEPSVIEINSDRALYWLGVGAQPTEQVAALLKLTGDWGTFKGEKGAKNTVKLAEPKPEFQADEKKKPILKPKADKTEAPEKADKSEKAEKAEKAEKSDDKADAPAAATEEKTDAPTDKGDDKADTPADKADKADKPAKADAPAKDAPAEAAKAEPADTDKG